MANKRRPASIAYTPAYTLGLAGGWHIATAQAQGNAQETRNAGMADERVIRYQQDRMVYGAAKSKLTEATLKEAFQRAAAATMQCIDGSTATTVVVTSDGLMHVANIADSPAMLFVQDKDGHVRGHYLIADEHDAKPKIAINPALLPRNDEVFLAQVQKVHYPISIARNLGGAPYGLPKEPDIQSFHLDSMVKPGERAFICVASDGITPPDKLCSTSKDWMVHYAQLLEKQLKMQPQADIKALAKTIIDEAIQQRRTAKRDGELGEQDNISLMLSEIPAERKEDVFLTVCDGHRAATLDGSDDMPGTCADIASQALKHALIKKRELNVLHPPPQVGGFRF